MNRLKNIILTLMYLGIVLSCVQKEKVEPAKELAPSSIQTKTEAEPTQPDTVEGNTESLVQTETAKEEKDDKDKALSKVVDKEESSPEPSAQAAPPKTKPVRPLGRLGYLSNYRGEVSVRRGEEVYSDNDIDFGFEIYPYDLISTGPKAYAEVDLNSDYAGGSYIRLSERTSFWFDLGDVAGDGSMKTDIRLLAGSLALKVEKLSTRGRVQINTEGSSFGVRGTEFILSLAGEASILVTCLEGLVACDEGSGTTHFAKPGQIVEKRFNESMRTLPQDIDSLGSFRSTWLLDRNEEFYANPSQYIRPYLSALQKWSGGVEKSAQTLRGYSDIWKKWEEALAAGKTYSFIELGNDKKKVNQSLFNAARELFFYESAHYRLKDMTERLQKPDTGISPRPLPAELAGIQGELRRLEKDLSFIRHIFRLYGAVSEDSPLGEFFSSRADADMWSF